MFSSMYNYTAGTCYSVPRLRLPHSLLDETFLWQWAEVPRDFLSTDVFAPSIMNNGTQFPCFDIRADIW